ncbi:SRPBCC family protein [Kineosporia sp. NBRC 101731]|uniref:SRPBCC family protein n=1 Tax=Kineosporia sp. NBRC 101731 TaxID=3032199 RepID=UPI0024A10AB9|nr:SRPBCC family protein [Kineosporia sp. NBRC 101731]GLY32335.1 hypothetical protein Kisp02_57000 [Kineosporia sp. NBRC 101731]
MAKTTTDKHLFEASAEIEIAALREIVYAVVTDLPRSGEWSTECRGGEWIEGAPATTGSVFRGHNERSPDVVAWAPVVRGEWSTEAEVVAADAPSLFSWAMRTRSGQAQDSIWTYELLENGPKTILRHQFRMGEATEGIRGIVADLDQDGRDRFFREWGVKIEQDMAATVRRIKAVVEAAGR